MRRRSASKGRSKLGDGRWLRVEEVRGEEHPGPQEPEVLFPVRVQGRARLRREEAGRPDGGRPVPVPHYLLRRAHAGVPQGGRDDDAAAAQLDRDGRRFVAQGLPLDSFRRPCLPAEGQDPNKEMPASMVEFTAGYCWPLTDQMANLVSSGVSFGTPGELESLDAISMEELMDLLWP